MAGTQTEPKSTVPESLMKLRFLMSHHRKNSVRDKVIGKKQVYLERNILHRVWSISEGKSGLEIRHA